MSHGPPRDDPRLSSSDRPVITPWAARRGQYRPPRHTNQRGHPPGSQPSAQYGRYATPHRPIYASNAAESAPSSANTTPLGGSTHPPVAAPVNHSPQVSAYRGGPPRGGYAGRGQPRWQQDRDRERQPERERPRDWDRPREVDSRDGQLAYRAYDDRDWGREERERERARDYRDDRPGPSQQSSNAPSSTHTEKAERARDYRDDRPGTSQQSSSAPSPSHPERTERLLDYRDDRPGPSQSHLNVPLPLSHLVPPPRPTGPPLSRPLAAGIGNGAASLPTGPKATGYVTETRTVSSGSRSPGGIDPRDRERDRERELERDRDRDREWNRGGVTGGFRERRERSRDRGIPNSLIGASRTHPVSASSSAQPAASNPVSTASTPITHNRLAVPPLSARPFAAPSAAAPTSSANHTPLGAVTGPPRGIPTGPRSMAAGSAQWDRDDRNRGRDRWERGSAADTNYASRQSDRASVRSGRSRDSSRSRARIRSLSPPYYGSSVGGSVAGGSGAAQGHRSGPHLSGPRATAGNMRSPEVDHRARTAYETNQDLANSMVAPRASSPPHRTISSVVPHSAGSSVHRRYDARSVDGISTSASGGGLGVGNWARRKELDRLNQELRQGDVGKPAALSTPATPSLPNISRLDGNNAFAATANSSRARSRESSRARSRSLSQTRNMAGGNSWPERRRSTSNRGSADHGVQQEDDSRMDSGRSSTSKPHISRRTSGSEDPVRLGDRPDTPTGLSPSKKPDSEKGSMRPESSPGNTDDGLATIPVKQEGDSTFSREHGDRRSRESRSHVPSTPPTPSTPATPSTPPLSPAPDQLFDASGIANSNALTVQDSLRKKEEESGIKAERQAQGDAPKVSTDNALGLRSPVTRMEVTFDHPPTSPLTDIQPSSPPARIASDPIAEPEASAAERQAGTRNGKAMLLGSPVAALNSSSKSPSSDDSRSDGTAQPKEENLPDTPLTPADALGSEIECLRPLEPYGEEYMDFDLSTYEAAKDLFKNRYTDRMSMNDAIDDVLRENNCARDHPNARAVQAKQFDSWQIARHKANHPSTWIRHVVVKRVIKGKEDYKRYVQALHQEWARLDEAWQKQRVIVEEENEKLRRIWEGTLPPTTPAADKDTRPAPRNRRRGAVDTEQQMLGIHDGDEEGMERIMANIRRQEEVDPVARARKTEAVIPDMILEPSGYRLQYDDNSSLVQDPLTFYDMNHETEIEWSAEEDAEFRKLYVQFPKRFGEIADQLPGRTASDCVNHYYLAKKEKAFKEPTRGGARQYKEVSISSIANSRNTITAPRARLVGMVRGKALVSEPVDKEPAIPAAPVSIPANSRKQSKRKLDDVDKIVVPAALPGKEDVPTAVAKVRKKPGPKPGTKRKATATGGAAAAAVPPHTGDAAAASAATPAKKRKTAAKPRAKKGANLTVATAEGSPRGDNLAGDRPVTPATASTVGTESVQRDRPYEQQQPYATASSNLTYPESMSFRPAASIVNHSAPYLPPMRDFMSVARVNDPTSDGRPYPSPSTHYPRGTHDRDPQRLPFNSTLPPAPVISVHQDVKESPAPPQVFRRSNINDLLNASNDEATQTPSSRSVPPPDLALDIPNGGLARSLTSPGDDASSIVRRTMEIDGARSGFLDSGYGRALPMEPALAPKSVNTFQYPTENIRSDRAREVAQLSRGDGRQDDSRDVYR